MHVRDGSTSSGRAQLGTRSADMSRVGRAQLGTRSQQWRALPATAQRRTVTTLLVPVM